jgi:hypothetical protein
MELDNVIKEAEQKQLDLNQLADLELFLESAKTVYAEAMEQEPVAKFDDYQKLHIEEFLGKEIFEMISVKLVRLQKLIDHCRFDLVPNNKEISDDQVTEMQELYNNLILLRDYIWEKYPGGNEVNIVDEETLEDIEIADKEYQKLKPVTHPGTDDQFQESGMKSGEATEDGSISTHKQLKISKEEETDRAIIIDDKIPTIASPAIPVKNNKTVEEDVQSTTVMVNDNESPNTRRAFSEIEKSDPVSQAVRGRIPTVIHSRHEDDETMLTSFLREPRHLAFINKYYGTVKNFERMLDTNVATIEDEMIDKLERWLGERPNSAFHFLRDRLVTDIAEMEENPKLRKILQSKRIKYESFVFWVDSIDEMKQIITTKYPITFGEMYARFMIETEIRYHEAEELKSNSQFDN